MPLFALNISTHKSSGECCGQTLGPTCTFPGLEISYPNIFASFEHNDPMFILAGSTLLSGCLGEQCSTC